MPGSVDVAAGSTTARGAFPAPFITRKSCSRARRRPERVFLEDDAVVGEPGRRRAALASRYAADDPVDQSDGIGDAGSPAAGQARRRARPSSPRASCRAAGSAEASFTGSSPSGARCQVSAAAGHEPHPAKQRGREACACPGTRRPPHRPRRPRPSPSRRLRAEFGAAEPHRQRLPSAGVSRCSRRGDEQPCRRPTDAVCSTSG